MRFILLIVAGFLSWLVLPAQNRTEHGKSEVRIVIRDEADVKILNALKLETDAASPDGSSVFAYLFPDQIARLNSSGLEYRITVADLQNRYRDFWNPDVPAGYLTYDQAVALADSLAGAFPSICRKVSYGTSVGGRQLAALKISDQAAADEGEPAILFDAGIHGDEVLNTDMLLRFARELCKGYGNQPVYTDLINSREIWLYYMVNPDGRVAMTRENQNGVDINRDFGYMWDAEGSSTTAFSQVETKALRQCLTDNRFVIYTNYHGGTEVVAYPWSYRSSSPPDLPHLDQLAGLYSSASGYFSLAYGQGYNIMYAIYGSTKDFQYGSLGNAGWSIETSEQKQPAYSQFNYYYANNLPAMVEMITRAGYGIEGTVTDSVTGQPVRASIWIDGFYPVCSDPLLGDYHKYILPGQHSVKVTANGYKTKTVPTVTVPATGSIMVDVQLSPDPHYYAYRVVGCRIPGANPADESFTPGALGAPDNIDYSLGKSGWVVIDMGDTLFNGAGNDVKIHESAGVAEGYSLACSTTPDGPWKSLGTGTGTNSFDLSLATGGAVPKARYLKVTDDGDGTALTADAGFDLDAVEMLTLPLIPRFTASETAICSGDTTGFSSQSTGSISSWSWQFPGGTPSSSGIQNPGSVAYTTPGSYDVVLTVSNGITSSTLRKTNYISVNPIPSIELGADTLLPGGETLTLDAGNPGCNYHWSTGETTQTVSIDSTGTGYGTLSVWVEVTTPAGCNESDTLQVTFTPPAGLAPAEKSGVNVYPNPVCSQMTIRSTQPGIAWSLCSPTGRVVMTGRMKRGSNETTITTLQLLPGFYLLEFPENPDYPIFKIILQK